MECNAKVALQTFIQPDSYRVGPETVGAGANVIDPFFSNGKLEWSTNRQGSTMIYGLLIISEVVDTKQIMKLVKEYTDIGKACRKAGQIQQAQENYERAANLAPDNADIYNQMGLTYDASGDLTTALDCYRQAVKVDSQHAEVYCNMGIAYRKQGQLKDAVDSYKHAVRLNPDCADACYGMGLVYKKQGQPKEAWKCYSSAMKLKPDFTSKPR